MIKIDLKFPVEFEGKKINSINLKRLTIGDIADMEEGDFQNESPMQQELRTISLMASQPLDVIRNIIDTDYRNIQKIYYQDFLDLDLAMLGLQSPSSPGHLTQESTSSKDGAKEKLKNGSNSHNKHRVKRRKKRAK